MNPHEIAPGTRLGPFTIIGHVGSGATASVFRAEDLRNGEAVALKVLNRDLTTLRKARAKEDDDSIGRLRRELTLVQRLNHSGICKVYELHELSGLLFVSMEFVPGRSLERTIVKESKIAPGRACRLLHAMCDAMAAAHEVGILHRDLKPSNVILRTPYEPVILDFGYAVGPEVTRVTRTGVWVGTLCYAAPELLLEKKANTKTDIFALGVTLYECVTGQLPFDGATYEEAANRVLACKAERPSQVIPDLPPELDAIIMRAIARDPNRRFATVDELRDALAPLAEPIPAPPPPIPPRKADPLPQCGRLLARWGCWPRSRSTRATSRCWLPHSQQKLTSAAETKAP